MLGKFLRLERLVPAIFRGGFSSGYGFSAGGAYQMGDKSSSGRVKIPGVVCQARKRHFWYSGLMPRGDIYK